MRLFFTTALKDCRPFNLEQSYHEIDLQYPGDHNGQNGTLRYFRARKWKKDRQKKINSKPLSTEVHSITTRTLVAVWKSQRNERNERTENGMEGHGLNYVNRNLLGWTKGVQKTSSPLVRSIILLEKTDWDFWRKSNSDSKKNEVEIFQAGAPVTTDWRISIDHALFWPCPLGPHQFTTENVLWELFAISCSI